MRGRPSATRSWPALLRGPAPTLPRPLDRIAEAWARLPARVRLLVIVATAVAGAAAVQVRIAAAEARWGGTPVPVLVATTDLSVGAAPTDLQRRALPPAVVPPGALAEVDEGVRLALALPEGSVLTRDHVDERGPAAGLADDLRVLPVPVEAGWGITRGAWVDVWVLGTAEEPARRVARSRPVLQVRADSSAATALLGLSVEEVAETTTGLAVGRVLLAHAPPP